MPTCEAGAGGVNRFWLAILGAYTLFLACVLLAAYLGLISTQLPAIRHFDTAGHFVLIGIAAVLLDLAWRGRQLCVWLLGRCLAGVPAAPMVVGAIAIVEEFAQLLSPNRTFDVGDLAASVAGIVVFFGLVRSVRWCCQPHRRVG